jgi:hypothetical protein
MRERINSDPKLQIGLIAILLLVGVVMLMKSGGGEESEEAPTTEATVSVEGTGISSTATGASPGEAVEGAVEGAVEEAAAKATPSTAPTTSELGSLEAPKLPRPVVDAYKADETVVLLVVHDGGIDDDFTKLASSVLQGDPDVALFLVPASKIYRYAAITLGAEVSRVPALVVMRPRKLSEGTPQATVSYGLQTRQDIKQAVRDATYDGPGATYHPG